MFPHFPWSNPTRHFLVIAPHANSKTKRNSPRLIKSHIFTLVVCGAVYSWPVFRRRIRMGSDRNTTGTVVGQGRGVVIDSKEAKQKTAQKRNKHKQWKMQPSDDGEKISTIRFRSSLILNLPRKKTTRLIRHLRGKVIERSVWWQRPEI